MLYFCASWAVSTLPLVSMSTTGNRQNQKSNSYQELNLQTMQLTWHVLPVSLRTVRRCHGDRDVHVVATCRMTPSQGDYWIRDPGHGWSLDKLWSDTQYPSGSGGCCRQTCLVWPSPLAIESAYYFATGMYLLLLAVSVSGLTRSIPHLWKIPWTGIGCSIAGGGLFLRFAFWQTAQLST